MSAASWYRVALARPDGPALLVAASGEHMGIAIAAARSEVTGSWPVAAEHANADEIPLGESVGKHHVVMLGDAPVVAPFAWPAGVLPALGRSAAVADAHTGWLVRPESELLVIEAQSDAEHVTDVFLGLIERLPAADNLEVRVMNHFEDAAASDIWLTSRINAKKALRFLDDHDEELIGNGHLELSIYVRAHKATLRLTEHKTVAWLAEGGALEKEVGAWLGELGVPHVETLVTVRDAPHFHYRPAKSLDRKKLGIELFRQRLRKVAVVPAA